MRSGFPLATYAPACPLTNPKGSGRPDIDNEIEKRLHLMTMSNVKRESKNAKRERAKTKRAKAKRLARASGRYYLTPRVWRRPCSHCGGQGAVAYRACDRKVACAACIDRLGIVARESQAWRDGGAKADPTVTVRHVDPATLRGGEGLS